MNILITGVTETHVNHPQRASSTKFVSIPELMREAYISLGHDVDHRGVTPGEDLSRYQKIFVYVYPLDHNAKSDGAAYTLARRPDAMVCLDDWSFQKIMASWDTVLGQDLLSTYTWIAPLFPWGKPSAMGLEVAKILPWDPSPLYTCPPVFKHAWQQRQTAWYNASLSAEAHHWAEKQNLTWPIHSVGGKALGQPRILESDVVWQYGSFKGILCPTYTHAGCGWWRVRYLHAMHAGCILGGDQAELGMIHKAYDYTLADYEAMNDDDLQLAAANQGRALEKLIATKTETFKRLESFLK